MIIMNLELNNLFAFKNFKMDFSYPKKIVNSTLEYEFLKSKTNFRYKKINILMGSNATGKTSIGKALMAIFNFISNIESSKITRHMSNNEKEASFLLDFLLDENTLYRVKCNLERVEKKIETEDESITETKEEIILYLKVETSKINKNDSYESCVLKLKEIGNEKEQENEENSLLKLKKIPSFGWLFTFPDKEAKNLFILKNDKDTLNLPILKKVLMALDNTIEEVIKSGEVENTYLIKTKTKEIIIVQDGEIAGKNILSTGTQSGLDIAYVLSSICKDRHGFYYCDEKFSYIQSDMEIALLNLMIECLKPNSQLFFTTHNLDILEMNLPVHSFQFLKKDPNKNIEIIRPEKFLQKNDRSLRIAVKNDIFDMAPDTTLIQEILEVCSDEI